MSVAKILIYTTFRVDSVSPVSRIKNFRKSTDQIDVHKQKQEVSPAQTFQDILHNKLISSI